MAVHSDSKQWCRCHYALGLSSREVQVYNAENKITFSTARVKSDILSLAFPLEVHIDDWIWTCIGELIFM